MKRNNEYFEKLTTIGDVNGLNRDYDVTESIHNCAVAYETDEQYNRDYREFKTIAKYELANRDEYITRIMNTSKIHFYYSNNPTFASRETKKRNI